MNKIKINYKVSEYENNLINNYNKNCEIINAQSTLNENALNLISENNKILNELNLLDTLNEEVFFEMAGFKMAKSGLSHNIWIDEAGKNRKNKHYQPRIKVQSISDPDLFIPILIDKNNPVILAGKFKKLEDISDIINFIKVSYDDLMKVWNQEIDGNDFIEKYKKK